MEIFREAKRKIEEKLSSKVAEERGVREAQNLRQLGNERRRRFFEGKFRSIKTPIVEVLREANTTVLSGKGEVVGWDTKAEMVTSRFTGESEYGGTTTHNTIQDIDVIRLVVPGKGDILVYSPIKRKDEADLEIKDTISVRRLVSNYIGRDLTKQQPYDWENYGWGARGKIIISLEQDNEVAIQQIAEAVASNLVEMF